MILLNEATQDGNDSWAVSEIESQFGEFLPLLKEFVVSLQNSKERLLVIKYVSSIRTLPELKESLLKTFKNRRLSIEERKNIFNALLRLTDQDRNVLEQAIEIVSNQGLASNPIATETVVGLSTIAVESVKAADYMLEAVKKIGGPVIIRSAVTFFIINPLLWKN